MVRCPPDRANGAETEHGEKMSIGEDSIYCKYMCGEYISKTCKYMWRVEIMKYEIYHQYKKYQTETEHGEKIVLERFLYIANTRKYIWRLNTKQCHGLTVTLGLQNPM